MIVEQVNGRLKTKWRILDARMECHRRHVPATIAAVVTLHNIEMLLGVRARMETTYPRNRWWVHGPAADLGHTGSEVAGFTPPLRRNRTSAFLYASWRLGLTSASSSLPSSICADAERALAAVRPLRSEPPGLPWSEAATLRALGDARGREGPGVDTDGLAAGAFWGRAVVLTPGVVCITGGAD
ncbi:unnamed protein product [Closterium sp. Naga37s-1]|nr:unnamed protein product [Closterium sp. Naga37s-1]